MTIFKYLNKIKIILFKFILSALYMWLCFVSSICPQILEYNYQNIEKRRVNENKNHSHLNQTEEIIKISTPIKRNTDLIEQDRAEKRYKV